MTWHPHGLAPFAAPFPLLSRIPDEERMLVRPRAVADRSFHFGGSRRARADRIEVRSARFVRAIRLPESGEPLSRRRWTTRSRLLAESRGLRNPRDAGPEGEDAHGHGNHHLHQQQPAGARLPVAAARP